jgi:hypothetical protein
MQTANSHQERKWLAWILGGLLASIGLLCLAVAGLRTWQAMATTSWPQVQAKVVQSDIDPVRDSKGRTSYRVVVRYLYEVDGIEFSADRVFFGESSFLLESDARSVLAPYPVGKVVTASYDPSDTASAVLEPGRPRNLTLLVVIGLVFGVPGLLVVALAPRNPG